MKMYYGNTPIKSMNIKHYEISTNDSNLQPSDMQAGIIAYGRGKRIIGTGKAFEFANYGDLTTNVSIYVPSNINVIEISSINYPIKSNFALQSMRDIDFSIEQNIGTIIINDNEYDLIVSVESNMLTVSCEETVQLQVFYGKDNYV